MTMRLEDWVPATKAQAAFAKSDADIAVFFGVCGGGKTSSLVHEAVKHPHALIVRRGPARMRATMHAQHGYAGEMLQWWFHAGRAIDARNGAVRWLLRADDKHYWFDAEADARASGRGAVWSVAVIAAEWTAVAGATCRDHQAYRDLGEDA